MGNRDVVAALYEAFAKRDLATVAGLTTPDLVVTQTELLPWGGTYHGHDGLKEFTRKLLGRVDSQVTAEEYIEAGDRVVVLGWTRGTVHGSGVPFAIRVAHVWTVKDGRAARFEPHIDTPGMLRALGERG